MKSKQKKQYNKKCVQCSKIFFIKKKYLEKTAKFCSYKCYWIYKKGKHFINSGSFKQGNPINIGRKRPDMIDNKLCKGLKPWNKGQRNGNQNRYLLIKTGEYRNLHYWVESQLGKPNECEFCHATEGIFQWANKSGSYLKILSDWYRLCIICHRKYDKKSREETLWQEF